jgi:hypothetical protein
MTHPRLGLFTGIILFPFRAHRGTRTPALLIRSQLLYSTELCELEAKGLAVFRNRQVL